VYRYVCSLSALKRICCPLLALGSRQAKQRQAVNNPELIKWYAYYRMPCQRNSVGIRVLLVLKGDLWQIYIAHAAQVEDLCC